MLNVFQELELAICPFSEDGGAEGFHNLLDSHGRAGELVLRRATPSMLYMAAIWTQGIDIPDEAEGTWGERRCQASSLGSKGSTHPFPLAEDRHIGS